ncbi:hypothetical protein DFH11DRAFT_1856924 [Phellopilus nigrolimitatus]|nr:hypothetical protein DFH11DRAFT_1856924 [Phellopilus nigrolimitatus]
MLPVASSTVFAFIAAYGILPAQAQLKPTAPGPNETFTAGSPCGVAWTPDSTGTWTNVTIDLMSGSNSNMSLVTNVATALDGTNKSLTPYSWTCPDVDPYSTIYFYQFTNGADTSTRTWTMRFTISSLSNETNPPENSQQPNGDPVPWGIGHLSSKAESSTASSSVDVGEDDDDAQNSFALPTASELPSNTRHHKAFSDADSADGPDDDDNADSSDEEDNGSHEEDNADGSHEEDNADGSHDEDNADGSGEEDERGQYGRT